MIPGVPSITFAPKAPGTHSQKGCSYFPDITLLAAQGYYYSFLRHGSGPTLVSPSQMQGHRSHLNVSVNLFYEAPRLSTLISPKVLPKRPHSRILPDHASTHTLMSTLCNSYITSHSSTEFGLHFTLECNICWIHAPQSMKSTILTSCSTCIISFKLHTCPVHYRDPCFTGEKPNLQESYPGHLCNKLEYRCCEQKKSVLFTFVSLSIQNGSWHIAHA